ncbi:sentrin-specific protease-like [Ptychodera flava]|uniref:sentrin-specific protease-like n=1 Tax=Ptychodera flava TaxID=63121 RepID=UPI003969EB54
MSLLKFRVLVDGKLADEKFFIARSRTTEELIDKLLQNKIIESKDVTVLNKCTQKLVAKNKIGQFFRDSDTLIVNTNCQVESTQRSEVRRARQSSGVKSVAVKSKGDEICQVKRKSPRLSVVSGKKPRTAGNDDKNVEKLHLTAVKVFDSINDGKSTDRIPESSVFCQGGLHRKELESYADRTPTEVSANDQDSKRGTVFSNVTAQPGKFGNVPCRDSTNPSDSSCYNSKNVMNQISENFSESTNRRCLRSSRRSPKCKAENEESKAISRPNKSQKSVVYKNVEHRKATGDLNSASVDKGNDDADDIMIVDVIGEKQISKNKIISNMKAVLRKRKNSNGVNEKIIFKELENIFKKDLSNRYELIRSTFRHLKANPDLWMADTDSQPTIAVTIRGHQITTKDMERLHGNNWLNDSIINGYCQLLMMTHPDIHIFSTYFYPQLKSKGYRGVIKWTKKINIFKKRLLMFPIHLGAHWSLVVCSLLKKTLLYLDSLAGYNQYCLKHLAHFLKKATIQFDKLRYRSSRGWKAERMKGIPLQQNTSDCGVFVCQYAKRLCKNTAMDFCQSDIRKLRLQMIQELHCKKLL